jgi:hypothetical protein
MSKYTTRITRITVSHTNFSDSDTHISIDDDGGGEFLAIEQNDNEIRIDPDEWPHIVEAVGRIIGAINGGGE